MYMVYPELECKHKYMFYFGFIEPGLKNTYILRGLRSLDSVQNTYVLHELGSLNLDSVKNT